MESLTVGDVVLVRFPFSDLSSVKVRPAIIASISEYDDYILCQITSKDYGDRNIVKITNEDFSSGNLKIESYVRIAKIFTLSNNLILSTAGKLHTNKFNEIRSKIIELFN